MQVASHPLQSPTGIYTTHRGKGFFNENLDAGLSETP